jgi:hypothetical protein
VALEIAERDWKRWRQLTPILLNRFCEGIVRKAATFPDSPGSGHEQFLALHGFLGDANRDVARVFDNPRRSTALLQIAAAVSLGILTREELASFSEELRGRVEAIVGIGVG